ncbi:Vitamin K epoxide reductase [Rubrobacter xylanophilus DSM 9941]|uniref:Vitamin K epoxide reductase n=1 Tax=Rubrobacter xylanophilus (strain DSM 9941 / JCM 11954 / NBRC 16129 / PRD-1) TaxID=266117 RepID=Q1ASG1_RUBXD|nr:vitamin K epoxide reductase family protein [Rubrobacter xylanophilus]ABG05667.1 Vitamin K epoxide reductase [Rubrobacter xylanophilus DSM 9941]
MSGRGVPPGWEENPTSWPRRLQVAALAAAGLLVAGYLTLYQLGLTGGVWDPFFPQGSPKVLRLFEPVPDAALGALAYGTEIVLSFVGGEDRWRTMPWTTLAFGATVFAGALVSVLLMIAQPVLARAWCTLCLASAGISLLLCGRGAEEPLASLQHLRRVRDSGGSVWRALWGTKGGG